MKDYYRQTQTISESVYILKKSFISNIRHIVSDTYEEHGLILNEMEDRIEIK